MQMSSTVPVRSIAIPFLLSVFLFTLSGCGHYSDNGLIGDYVVASKCPANGCANQVADPNYISLKAGVTSIVASPSSDRVDISGDCYPSTYPQNAINVKVTQNTGAVIPVEAASADPVLPAPNCKNGRFDISLAVGPLPANSAFTVRLELVGIESNGASHTNAAGGYANITLRK
jgi:hypothetical protein